MRKCPWTKAAVFLFVSLCGVLLSGCALYGGGALLQSRESPPTLSGSSGLPVPANTTLSDEPSLSVDEKPITDPYLGVEITFLAVGDNLIHPNIYMDAGYRKTGEKQYDFLPMYADAAEMIAEADFAFINQETVMAGESYGYSGYPLFNSPRQLGLDLVTLGFDLVNIANNHMLDMGSAGLADTFDFWKSQPVTTLGAEDADWEVPILEKDGVKIAFLSWTYGTNGMSQRSDAAVKVPYVSDDKILTDIQAAGEKGADIIIASVHWGVENTHTPTNEQERLAQLMADNGVDVILGHHSHCLQPVRWIEGADGGRTLCVYSLGNFVSGMAQGLNHVGGIFTFSVTSDGKGGLEVTSPLLTPTVFYFGPGWFNTHLYFLEDYTEEIAASHGIRMEGSSLSAAKARETVLDVIDPEFLPEWLTLE